MPKQIPLLVSCVLPAFLSLGAQEASQPVYHTQDVPVMGWTADADSIHSVSDAQTISLQAMDVSVDSGGVAHLAFDRQVSDWDPVGAGLKATAWRSFPGMVQPATSVNRLKYRLGTFWLESPDNTQIQRWDGTAHTWSVVLEPGVEFSDFEVTSSGQIVLIRTFGKDREHLFECFEQKGERPVATEDLPGTGLGPAEASQYFFYWSSFKAALCDDYVAVYAQDCGRLFVYDARNHGMHEIGVPWQPVTADWIRSQVRDYGVINLNRFPGVRCLEFLPTGTRNALRVAYQIPARAPRKQVLLDGKPAKVKVGNDPAQTPVEVAELDFSTMTLKEPRPVEGLHLPLWIQEDGDLGPIQAVLAKARAQKPSRPRARH